MGEPVQDETQRNICAISIMNSLKLFDMFSGIGGFSLVAKNLDIDIVGHAEIDQYAEAVYSKHFSNMNFGDALKLKNIPRINILTGGSPCQDLSIAKSRRMGLKGSRSNLFYTFVDMLKIAKPKYFLFENVASMTIKDKNIITDILGVEPIKINSALMVAQQRKRLYWTNIPNVIQPVDRGIYLQDILVVQKPDNLGLSEIKKDVGGDRNKTIRLGNIAGKRHQANRVYSTRGKSVSLSANGGGWGAKTGLYLTKEGIRKLIPIECERLQGFPDGWTDVGISNTQRLKGLGNAITVPVVRHILKSIMRYQKSRRSA